MQVISDKNKDVMAKFGAIIAQGIIDMWVVKFKSSNKANLEEKKEDKEKVASRRRKKQRSSTKGWRRENGSY